MKSGKFGFIGKAVFLMVLLVAVALIGGHSTRGAAGTHSVSPSSSEQIIFSFLHGDGNQPNSLIRDGAGNLYGTSGVGGSNHAGNVFELSPRDGGGWSFTVLHSFGYEDGDGMNPGPLTMDAVGNLYGVTLNGGTGAFCAPVGCGVVFELSPESGGSWSKRILHDFAGPPQDGQLPSGTLVFDPAGNLWDVTNVGGSHSKGTVFELLPKSGGGWAEKIRYNFKGGELDGYYPGGPLAFDSAGNVYGTTQKGGAADGGTAYVLAP